jgi:hypothetical protein
MPVDELAERNSVLIALGRIRAPLIIFVDLREVYFSLFGGKGSVYMSTQNEIPR